MIRIKRGLDIPLEGSPQGTPEVLSKPRSVGLLGPDYNGMKPTMLVNTGDKVKLGQGLFEDKKNPGVIFTSPAGGIIQAINRGARRKLQSVVIELDQDELSVIFKKYTPQQIESINSETIREQLVKSGLWTSFRTRPYSKTPRIDDTPNGLFINLMDTNPLALDPNLVISIEKNSFNSGINLLKNLLNCHIYLCTSNQSKYKDLEDEQLSVHEFLGVHPSGLTGTHMHYLSPASATNILWAINFADIINIGGLFLQGQLSTTKYISLAGPQVIEPKIVKTRIGASIDELCAGQLKPSENRIISGSVLNGREAIGAYSYLGKFHNQISVIEEANSSDREFLNWLRPGFNKHSQLSLYAKSFFSKNKKIKFKTLMNGADRAIVPLGVYEEVFPFQILITILLRYIAIGDTEKIQSLGALELDEEDLALCSYVCPSKYDFGSLLRTNLTTIQEEG